MFIKERTLGNDKNCTIGAVKGFLDDFSEILSPYKIDHNPDNAGYRTWERTRTNNSGAEKFVVYFAIILALMNYSRSEYGDIASRSRYTR